MFAFGVIFTLLFLSSYINGFQYSDEALLDQVVEMPGLHWRPNFNHFSGYLNLKDTRIILPIYVTSNINSDNIPILSNN